MTRARCTFRASDLTRALKAAKAAGFETARVEIEPDGKIVILTGKAEPTGLLRRWKEQQGGDHAGQA